VNLIKRDQLTCNKSKEGQIGMSVPFKSVYIWHESICGKSAAKELKMSDFMNGAISFVLADILRILIAFLAIALWLPSVWVEQVIKRERSRLVFLD